MKPKPFMSLTSVMLPGPSLKWLWISSFATAGQACSQQNSRRSVLWQAAGLVSHSVSSETRDRRPSVPPGLSDSRLSPATIMAQRPRGENTRSWNVLLHTITRKISQVETSGGNLSSHLAMLKPWKAARRASGLRAKEQRVGGHGLYSSWK